MKPLTVRECIDRVNQATALEDHYETIARLNWQILDDIDNARIAAAIAHARGA